MLNSDTGTKQMGFGMAIGILLASFVVSTLLGPGGHDARRRRGLVAVPGR